MSQLHHRGSLKDRAVWASVSLVQARFFPPKVDEKGVSPMGSCHPSVQSRHRLLPKHLVGWPALAM